MSQIVQLSALQLASVPRMNRKPQAGTAQRTLSTPVLVERPFAQAKVVAMLRTSLDVQSNRIAVYEDSRRAADPRGSQQ